MKRLSVVVLLMLLAGLASGVRADEQDPASPLFASEANELVSTAPAVLERLLFTPAWKSHQCNPGCIETCWCEFVHCKACCGGSQPCINSCINQRNSCVSQCPA